jgi:hypothetical protein
MFKNFIAALQIVKNRDKIKKVVNETYSAIVKTLDALEFINKQVNDTKLGRLLQQYLPQIITVLSKVKEIFEKYGPFFGLEVVEPQRLETEQNLSDSLTTVELKLNEILKE